MRSKTIFASKIFYGAVTTIALGVIAYTSGNKAEGITGIVTGLGIIAARLNTKTKAHIVKPKV